MSPLRQLTCFTSFPCLFAIAVSGCSGPETTAGDAGHATGDAPAAAAANGVGAAAGAPAARGGACIERGECAVRKIADGLPNVSPVTFSDGVVWAVASKKLVRIDASGAKTFETNSPPGLKVAAVGGFVFWDYDDYLLAMDPNGEIEDVVTSGCDDDSPRDLSVHESQLFYRCSNRLYALDVPAIDLEDVRMTAARNTSFAATLSGYPHAVTVDTDGAIYWADKGHSSEGPLELMKRVKSEVTVASLDDTGRTPAIVATPTHLVFADYGQKSVVAVSKSGGEPVTVADNQGDTYQMTVDESGVYWASRQGIMRAELDGSGARLLAKVKFTTFVGNVAVSPDAIYWTSPGDGAIYAMTK